ncbi:MAG: DUF2238 domain-containing protein [Candidatus Spechtbacterales bacterium]
MEEFKITKSQLLQLIKYPYFGPPFLLLIALHMLGVVSFYYTTSWYDSVLHLAGGFWVGLVYLEWAKIRTKKLVLSEIEVFKTVIFVLMIGIAWEIFEIVYDFSANTSFEASKYPPLSGGTIDTFKDLILDMVGALMATFSVHRANGSKSKK